jgi:NAD(P)-dependent dehydrogenase (short-subunit alcohol dehydrogenase family)
VARELPLRQGAIAAYPGCGFRHGGVPGGDRITVGWVTVNGVMIVTGGSRGIGAATARLASERGWAVCVGFRDNEAAAHDVVATCRAGGAEAMAVRVDVGVEREVIHLFEQVDRGWGPPTALVNNAGIVAPQSRVADLDAERINRVLTVNTLGAFLCAREAVRRMSGGGAIVNVSSRAAVLGSPAEYVDYAAAKAGVDALTVGLAKEVGGAGIRVNAVRPGLIETDIHAAGGEPGRIARLAPTVPMRRSGTVNEVAEAILWLASPAASYVTGSFVDVAGGR